jgi:hypothetical protein
MPYNSYNLLLSIRRTVVPIVVGAVGASILGGYLPDALVAEWTTVLLASVYYVALRLLEVQFPKVGLLLGGRGIPTYTDPELERRAFEDFVKAITALEQHGESL